MKLASNPAWWRFARVFQTMTPEGRKKVFHGRSSRAHMLRIAEMHPATGEPLDELHAPLRVYLFVAYAHDRPQLPLLAGQRARFEGVTEFFEERARWPHPREFPILAKQIDAKWLGAAAVPPPPKRATNGPRRSEAEAAAEAEADRRATLDAALAIATTLAGQNPKLSNLLEQVKSLHRR